MSKTRTLVVFGAVCVLFLIGAANEASAGEKGLIGYWKFDEGKGAAAADSSGTGNNGKIHGTVTWAKGVVGSALKFDGASTWVDIAKSASLDNCKQITLMAWIKTPLQGRHTIFERWSYGGKINERALELDVSSTRKIVNFGLSATGAGGGWLTSTTGVPVNKWVHIAVTSDGLKKKIYINGQVELVTGDAPEKIHASAANLHIGVWKAEGKSSGYFDGLIDEAKIYSRALTAMEILNQYKKDAAKGAVEGRVRDTNKKPIAGATVKIGLFSTTTDAKGNFSLPDVPVAVYRVTAIKKGYVRKTKRNVEIEEDDETYLSFKLKPDTTAPVMSDVKTTDKASLSAVITWTTDELTSSEVKIGTASGKYTKTAGDAEYSKTHSVALTGLKPETKYFYTVASIDKAENSAQGKELSFTTDKLGGVIIWDTNKKYLMKGPTPHAMKDREKWTQVPYGVTDYTFRGDPMIQNECGQLFLFTNKGDSVDFAARLETGGIAGNEIYKVYDKSIRHFGMGTVSTKILKNTPDEMVVRHVALSTRQGERHVITNYTMQAGKPWLHILPVEFVNQQGMHGKTRICAYVNKDGTEVIFDSKRFDFKREIIVFAPEGTIGIINFDRNFVSKYDFMWFLMLSPGAEKNPRTYLGIHADPFWGEEVSPDRPSIGGEYVYMTKDMPAAIATLRYRNCWTRENVEKPIKAGGTYTTKFAPPYPGKWRLIGRIENPNPAEKTRGLPGEKKIVYETVKKFYGSTVNVTKADVAAKKTFTFTSKVGGELDYVLMYLRERNGDTPKDICTPMDAYKGAILKK